MITFAKDPDMDEHLDHYYAKQEEYQKITLNSRQPVTEADMGIQLVKHMCATGTHTKATVKFNQLPEIEQMRKKAKSWFREVVKMIDEMEKYPGIDGDLLANAAVIKEKAVQEARDKIARGSEHSVGQLAQAAVAKVETIHTQMSTIASPTMALAMMTTT